MKPLPEQYTGLSPDLSQRLDSLYHLQSKLIQHELSGDAAQVARRTVANLALQCRAEDIVAISYAYRQLQATLAQLLESWTLNQKIIQQNLHECLARGDAAEVDRLNSRLAGITLLWEQIDRALKFLNHAMKESLC